MLYTPNIVIIPLLDLPVFKLRYPLAHRVVPRLFPFIFPFLSTFTNKMSKFFTVMTSAFVLINHSASHPRASYVGAIIKPASASKSTIWSEVSILIHAISLITSIGKILTPRPECPISLVSSVVSGILCRLTPIPK